MTRGVNTITPPGLVEGVIQYGTENGYLLGSIELVLSAKLAEVSVVVKADR